MYRLRNRFFYGGLLFVLMSCGFMDLRPIGLTVEPEKSDTVLPGEYSPVVLRFDTEMERPAAESIVKISSDGGMVEGDFRWEGNRLFFIPVPGWTAGIRYMLNLSGTVKSCDGRELRLEKFIFFYAINKSTSPVVEWFSPNDGASVGTVSDDPSGIQEIVEIRFSCPMEKLSTQAAFSVEGIGDKVFHWSDDDRCVKIVPEKNLSPWTVYRWTLKTGAKSREGVPLAKAVSAQFSTDSDLLIPKVENVYPVINSSGRWLPSGGGIESDLGPGQGIAVQFNKPMGDNALNSLRFDPSLAGKTEKLSETSIVFIPNRDPQPKTVYTLIVSADAKDTGGLRMGTDFRTAFAADIPYLRLLSFSADGAPVLDDFGGPNAFTIPVDVPGGGVLRFTICFSLPFGAQAKQDTALKISLQPFFPGNLAPIALRFVSWISDDRLRMEWEGLKPGTTNEARFYRLLIPGGRGGIDTGEGMYLAEDQYLYLEAR